MSLSLERKIYQHPVTIKRYTALICDRQDIAASLTVSRQPSGTVYLQFNFENLVGTGTITVTGTSGGSPNTEVITITTSKPRETVSAYTAITSIATSGLTSGTIYCIQRDENREDLRQLKSSTSDYMFIDIRDVRDTDVVAMKKAGFEVITSHIGFCFQGTALTLNLWDEIIDYYGVVFQFIYSQRQPVRSVYENAIWETALKQMGAEAYIP